MKNLDTSVSENGTAVSGKLDRAVLKVAAVVVLGSIMAIHDTTVVNVALQEFTLQFRTSFDTIQWVSTGYMLTLAAVIPVTGWASDRFGTKRLYSPAISLFLVGSVLTMALFSVSFFGVMLLFPTYFLLVRGESAFQAGLLLAPQGIGALITMPIGGTLADRLGAGKVVLPTSQGQLAATAALADPDSHQAAATAAAESFATTFTWALVLMVVCAIPAVLLPRRAPAANRTEESEAPLVMPTH